MGLLALFGGRYRHLKRYNQILRIFFKYGFEDLVSYMEEKKRFRFLRKFIPQQTIDHAVHLTKWERMRLACEELGPTFVKFGQLLSNRPDLLPADLIKELEKLQDAVPPIDGELAAKVVETELKHKVSELFLSFETNAFASASMAQVHRATLKTGENVVLKIQRPGIKEIIESDIRVMKYVAQILLNRMPSLKSIDPPGLVKNFEESIIKELDFIHESVNIQRFHANFSEDKRNQGHIHSPKVYSAYTTAKVLTLEFIQGIKINDFSRLTKAGLDRKVIAERLADSFFRQIFDYGFFHADPHPGNLFVLEDNVVCFLDYGMMGNIMRKDIEQLGYMFLAVKSKDVRKIIKALQALSDQPVIKNFRELETDLNEFVENHAFRAVSQNEMSTILLDLKDIIVKHGIKAPSHFFLLARAMVTAEGLIRALDPMLDLEKMARPYMVRTVARHYNPIEFAKKIFGSLYELGMYMEDFPRDLKTAIRKINTGEIKVDLRHKGIDPLLHTIHRTGRQLVSALMLASLIISSTLLIIYKIHPWWGTNSAFGIIGYIMAVFIGIGMMRNSKDPTHT
jgi:ubiquinone biosynthesis protein